MKRILIIGAVAFVLLSMFAAAVAVAVAVVPLRAELGQVLSRALEAQPVLAAALDQSTTTGPQLKAEKGVLVGGVFVDSPADKAGIVRGDILLQADNTDINTNADLKGVLAKHKAGDSLSLLVQHGDQQKTLNVTLTEAPVVTRPSAPQSGNGTPNNQPAPKAPAQTTPYLGIVPVGIHEGLGKLDRIHPSGLILQVASGSPAEKAGLKVGETITAVDGTAINAQNGLSKQLASHKPGDAVKLSVTGTDGKSRDVTVTLGDNPQKAGTAYLGVSVGGGGPWGDFGMLPGGPNGMPFRFHGGSPKLAGHQGALIDQVTTGSPAEKAGLKSGQLIETVDGKPVNSQTALSDLLTAHKPGDKVTLSVFDPQANKSSDVQVTLGDNPQKAGSAWLGISYGYITNQPRKNNASGTNL